MSQIMIFLIYLVKEKSTQKEGYASCWIKQTDFPAARDRALSLLTDSGWYSFDCVEEKIITRESYLPENEGLKYFDQAMLDDEVVVIFTLPKK